MPFDVAAARQAGYSDAEIANHLAQGRGFDIAAARKSGYQDSELVSYLSEATAKPKDDRNILQRGWDAASGAYRKAQDALEPVRQAIGYDVDEQRQKDAEFRKRVDESDARDIASQDGFFDRAGDLFKRGELGMRAGGYRAASAMENDPNLRADYIAAARAAEGAAKTGITGEATWEDVTGNWAKLPRFIAEKGVESLPYMASSIAGVGGFLANTISNTGQIAQTRAEANGNEDAGGRDLALAAPAGIGSAMLDMYGIESIFGAAGKNAATRILKAAGTEAATEGVQSGIEYTGGHLGTDKGMDAGEMGSQMLQGALVGAGMGGAVRGVVETGQGGINGAGRIFRLSKDGLAERPIAPGVRDVAAREGAVLTPEDEASPIPNDILQAGKAQMADVTASSEADSILANAGMPKTGKRVAITMPGGEVRFGIMRDAFNTDAGELGQAAGLAVDMEDGSIFTEHFDTLNDVGVSIAEAAPRGSEFTAEADAIDSRLAAMTASPVATEVEAPTVEPVAQGKTPKGGHLNGDILQGLINRGLPEHVARGATAGIHAESASKIDAINPTSGAMALGQWLGPRKKALIAKYGPNPTLDQQLDFLVWELKGGDHGGKHVLAAKDEVEALDAYIKKFMRPAKGAETDGDMRRGLAALGGGVSARSIKRERDDLGLREMGSGMASGMSENLRSTLLAKVEAGETTEAGGPSTLLQVAKAIRDQGADVDASTLERIQGAIDAARGTDTFNATLQQFVTSEVEQAQTAASPVVRQEIEQEAAAVAAPTEAQKEAGNYRKGHIKLHGLDITIETPRGAERSGIAPDGSRWAVAMPDHYGYVRRTKGADGEQIDVYVGPKPESDKVYLVDQNDADTGAFDEHKGMLGYESQEQALAAYNAAFDDGRGPQRIGNVTEMSAEAFRAWLQEEQTAPAAETAPPTALASGTGAQAPAISDMPSGKSVIVLGLDNSPEAEARIRQALPEKAKPLWNAKERGWVVSKKHEAKLRAALASAPINDTNTPIDSFVNDDGRLSASERAALERLLIGKAKGGEGWHRESSAAGQVQAILNADRTGNTDDVKLLEQAQHLAERAKEPVREAHPGLVIKSLQTGKETTIPGKKLDVTMPVVGPKVEPHKSAIPDAETATPSKPDQETDQPNRFAGNKIFTEDAVAAARARLKAKLNRVNSGIDPELLMDGIVIAGAHIEAGVRRFADIAKVLADDLGTSMSDLKPYLRAWYNGARDMLEDAGEDVSDMDGPGAVKAALTMIEDTATMPAQSDKQAVEKADDAIAEPARTEGDGGASVPERSAPSVSPSEGERGTGSDPKPASGSSERDVRGDDAPSRNADRADEQPSGTDDGKPEAKKASGRDRSEPSSRVRTRGKPKRADRGLNYSAPAGTLKREGGWKTTAERNLNIVELVNRLDADQRQATPEEQKLLAKFTGWGAGEIRNNLFRNVQRIPNGGRRIVPPAFGEWKDLGQRAAELLQGPALETALQSTQYAHYTSEPVIRSIWSAVRQFGFEGGKIIEPGMGNGLFAVAGPKSVMEESSYTGIELDGFTAKVASYLLPEENIIPGDFSKQKLPNGFFDLAIGNPPFADVKVLNDPEYKRYRFSLHDYFFAKTIDKLRPGGIMAFVTSRYTMDKQSAKAREYLADRADLLGAIRLPQTAFKENAGTEVVTDVLFFQRRAPGQEAGGQQWTTLEEIDIGGTKHFINRYYAEHPEMVLGKHATTGSMYRANEYTVEPGDADIEAAFAKAVKKLPKNIYVEAAPTASALATAKTFAADMRPAAEKEGSLYLKDGQLYRRDNGIGKALEEAEAKLSAKDKAFLTDYVALRDGVKAAQRTQLEDGDWQSALKALNKTYDAFVAKHGQISAFSTTERKSVGEDGKETILTYRRFTNRKRLEMDVESSLVEALEKISDDGTISKGPFLLDRTLKKPTRPEIKTAHDAVAVTLDEVGKLDLPYAANLLGKDVGEVISELGDEVYQAPSGEWLTADDYLSGDVVAKLDEAEVAARLDPRLERNVSSLRAVQPKPLAYSDIAVRLGAGWIEPHVVESFEIGRAHV